MTTWRLLVGDVRERLAELEDGSVQCVVTSPPYWGLRDYGVDGQLGLERTPEEYVTSMVAVFREVRRVLRDDGTLWLNLGDCYATGAGNVGECPGGGEQGARWRGDGSKHDLRGSNRRDRRQVGPAIQPNRLPLPGLKPKDLVGMPWRLAFALQADGWWLRSDIIWAKPNPMPESVSDRPTKAHEYVFLMTKSARYYYDADAVREDARYGYSETRGDMYASVGDANNAPRSRGGSTTTPGAGGSRNARTVWTIPAQPFSGAHFAVFPPALVEPCVKAGSRIGDTVLDPFAGAGTTLMVAIDHGRSAIGIDLNPEYAELARKRLRERNPLFATELA